MFALVATQADWTLHYERSGFLETGRYQEAVDYCRRLAKANRSARVVEYGKSPEGRPMIALLISESGDFDAHRMTSSAKPLIFVQNGIHSGEIEGKDASLMLARDMLIHKKHPELLKGANWLIVPIFSVDAHERFSAFNRINQNGPREMGWRANSQNLNLNRDWIKADAPEMRAQLGLLHKYKPDFFFDNHTTDGMDFQYTLTVDLPSAPTLHPALADWNKKLYTHVKSKCDRAGILTAPYLGASDRSKPENGFTATDYTPRFTHSYVGILNRPAMLVETHVLKPYRERVDATYRVMVETVGYCIQNAPDLKRRVKDASSSLRTGSTVVLDSTLTPEKTPYTFLGFEYVPVDSPITGSKVAAWDRTKPITVETTVRNTFAPGLTASVPDGYAVAPACLEAIDRLGLHGIKFRRLTEATKGRFTGTRFSDVRLPASSFEGRQMPSYKATELEYERTLAKETSIIEVTPENARLLVHLLEPMAPDSFAKWGFMNAFFEQKEYGEDYAVEPLAQKMLRDDEELRAEFNRRLGDPVFANSPSARLRFFFERSSYNDFRLNEYPVVRLNKSQLQELQKKSRQ